MTEQSDKGQSFNVLKELERLLNARRDQGGTITLPKYVHEGKP